MGKISTLINLLKEDRSALPRAIVSNLSESKLSMMLPDALYLKLCYRAYIGKKLNLRAPKTFNEKLQWLKLHERHPEYNEYVDKYEVKKYITERVGKKYIIPTIGVWNRFDDIDFDIMPNQFVLKCTHDSKSTIVCKNKKDFDIEQARQKIERKMSMNLFWHGREWPYKDVKPRIIVEKYMEDEENAGELTDYKIHCFNGEPKVIQVITDRFGEDGMINDHYYPSWEKLALTRGGYTTSDKSIVRPQELDELLELARKLSEGFAYIRTDFYIVNHQIYFGELTFFPASGFNPFHPEKWDYVWGDWIKLPTDGNT